MRKPRYVALPAAKRMRLTKTGEIRALARLGGLPLARFPILEGGVMQTELEDRVYNASITLDRDPDTAITLDLETSAALLDAAWREIEEQLIEANAAYNATAAEPHERILRLVQALNAMSGPANVAYQLTPMPKDLIDE